MGLDAFLIELDHETGRFVSHPVHPTLVTGRVVILTGNTKLMEGVQLHFRGDERIVWMETVGEHTVSHREQRKFFSESLYMFGGAQAGTRVLSSGRYSYPFRVTLPANMPSSLRVRRGVRTKYTLEAVVGTTSKTVFNTKREIRVVAKLPMATLPMMLPRRYSKEKHLSCLWCRSGHLTLVLGLPSRGVVVGRDFPVTMELNNVSNADVRDVVAKVKKDTITFGARESKTVCRFSFGALARRNFVIKTVLLPPLSEAPVNVDRCQLITVFYKLVVTARTSRCYNDLQISVPINFLTAAAADHLPLNPTPLIDANEHQPSAPPLSYEPPLDG